jgi:hypothetical protein
VNEQRDAQRRRRLKDLKKISVIQVLFTRAAAHQRPFQTEFTDTSIEFPGGFPGRRRWQRGEALEPVGPASHGGGNQVIRSARQLDNTFPALK